MNRRTFIRSFVGGIVLGGSGCLAQRSSTDSDGQSNETTPATEENDTTGGNGSNEGNGTNEEDGAGNETGDTDDTGDGSPTKPKSEPTLVKRSFNIVSGVCGNGKRETRVTFDDHSVHVTGTISGQNSCYTAELKNATLEQETLTVDVRSFENDTNELCSMCLKEIEYDATCTFENGLPKRVVVAHNDTQVTSEKRTQPTKTSS